MYEHRITDTIKCDGFPRILPGHQDLKEKKLNEDLLEFCAETIIKPDPDKKDLISEVKCKKAKGSVYKNVVKITSKYLIKNFKN